MDTCPKCGTDLTLPGSVHTRTISPIQVRGSYDGGQLVGHPAAAVGRIRHGLVRGVPQDAFR